VSGCKADGQRQAARAPSKAAPATSGRGPIAPSGRSKSAGNMNLLNGTATILKAAEFAASKHRDQRRKGVHAEPYINHPLAVASLLANEGGVDDPDVIAAALLHDTIEDTRTTEEELREVFGERVASIVAEVTDDKALSWQRRKDLQVEHAPHLSREAKLVKLADKICNVRDVGSNPPHDWTVHRRRQYFDWAGAVVAGMRGANPALEAIFDAACAARP
jgi:guanosine-3',5'-bis(diphosphate) 3'-pyrophosphohydrolase